MLKDLLLPLLPPGKFATKSLAYKILESRVPEYELPNVLNCLDGTEVNDKKIWQEKRRSEILKLYRENVYGFSPEKKNEIVFEQISYSDNALDGRAIRKEIKIYLTGKKDETSVILLIYLPKNMMGKVPTFVGLNFYGNHTINSDPEITLHNAWSRNNKEFKVSNNKASEGSRGVRSGRWQAEYIVEHGYALATAYYGEISPDRKDGLPLGLHKDFIKSDAFKRSGNDWGAISAWSWGLSRFMDYFEKDNDIDEKKVIVMGHSRLGKTSLWTGAQDQRFAAAISNCSGCGGAAIFRRKFGETVKLINRAFPHWFSLNFKNFNDKEETLPIDQHMLISLIAPRPVYVASANRDIWADLKGEFLSAKNAIPVYRLFGNQDLEYPELPKLQKPISKIIGHHIRKGRHNVRIYDWTQYIKWADKFIK